MADLTRRGFSALGLGAVAAPLATPLAGASAGPGPGGLADSGPGGWAPASALPDRAAFDIAGVYLNAGSQHPVAAPARAALEAYLTYRSRHDPAAGYRLASEAVLGKFAALAGADPDEVTFVQSTTTGEQMILRALGLPEPGAPIVTDTLHFFGSLPIYLELEKAGCEVTFVRPRAGEVRLEDLDKAIRPGTRLVSVSLVSTINGFRHDLGAICEIAHARGALVYADIIHAAGCIPLDLKASGVDFAACSSYKWLMGDFGLGFLYVRRGAREALARTQAGYYALSRFTSHVHPHDPPGEAVASYAFSDDTAGLFALGTYSHTGVALLGGALDYIAALGVDRIQAHAGALTGRLREGLLRLGHDVMTPPDTGTPLVAFALPGARERLQARYREAGITTTVSANRVRPSVSVFNSAAEIDHFLEVTGPA